MMELKNKMFFRQDHQMKLSVYKVKQATKNRNWVKRINSKKTIFQHRCNFYHKFETRELLRVSERHDLENIQQNDTLIGMHLNYEVNSSRMNCKQGLSYAMTDHKLCSAYHKFLQFVSFRCACIA